MRPNTLAEAVERIEGGTPQDVALAEFVDTFDLAPTIDAKYATIESEPQLTRDPKLNALVGAMAEYLAKNRRLGRVPHWTGGPARRLPEPWFTTASPTPAMREYLTFASPGEFASRNIFTEERPLRRARGPRPPEDPS
jgi:hypothetical protein